MPGPVVCPRCAAALAPEDAICPHCGAEAAALAAPAPDVPLPPRYEIKFELGRGGMGRVYLCRDRDLDVDVAVKVLPPSIARSPKHLARIESEAKVAARLRGLPGILPLYGFERHGDACLLVMEYAAGGSVFDRMADQNRIPEAGCRRVGAEVADALAQAHGRGVLHRDIKPGNVLLDIHGRVKVADFGLAHIVEGAYGGPKDVPLEGTPVYMPPEVLRGDGADGRSDLYALGAMLYEMATGQPPYRGSTRQIRDAKTAPGHRPPDPRALQPALSPEFGAIVLRLMATDPADRFPGAAATAEALRGRGPAEIPDDAPAAEAVPVLLPSAAARAAPKRSSPERSSPAAAAAIGGAVLLAAGAGAFLALRPKPATDAPPPAPAPEAPSAPAPASDVLVVVTKPVGAMVLVDGSPAGRTESEKGLPLPMLVRGVPHVISATLEDHEPDEQRGVVVEEGRPAAPVVLRLVPRNGILTMEGGPAGGRVAFRREGAVVKQFTLRHDGTLPAEILDCGVYEVEVEAQGFRPWRKRLRVVAGRNDPLRVAAEEDDGFLTVDTRPTGAEVLRQGTSIGTTPLKDVRLPPGAWPLVFDHPESSRIVREVVIRGGATSDLGVVDLPPPATMDLAGLPPGVTAEIEGQPVAGPVRRAPGPVAVTFRLPGHRPQHAHLELKSGPNPLPALAEWEPLPGRIDLAAAGKGASFVVVGPRAFASPWTSVEVRPGIHTLLFARTGAPLLPLRIAVGSGAEVLVPEPVFPPPFRGGKPSGARDAVAAGLDWLVRHQADDGSFPAKRFGARCKGAKCPGEGNAFHDSGVTSLAVLAILGGRAVEGVPWDGAAAWKGLQWLLEARDSKGTWGDRREGHFVYNHALGTLAVLEGYRATGSPWLYQAAHQGVNVVLECQNPYLGWRYGVRPKDNDTSVTSWMAKVLAIATEEGIPVDPAAMDGAIAWFDQVTEPEFGRAGYTAKGNGPARPEELMDDFPSDKSESLTAAAIAARLACGESPSSMLVDKGLDLCMKTLPAWSEREGSIDFYYWYLGTQAVHRAGGPRWEKWNEALSRALLPNQHAERGSCLGGSWDAKDPWAENGGRAYSTAINVLSLEVPWREAAAFREAGEPTTLTLESDPTDALVYLDDRYVGRTPLAAAPVPAGAATLRLVHPEKAEHRSPIQIAPFAANAPGRVALPASDAALDLGDLPKDATAAVEGREAKGRFRVHPGRLRLTVTRPGSFAQVMDVDVAAGETRKPVLAPWKPAPDLGKAVLKGLVPPPEPALQGLRMPAGAEVHNGRILWSRDRAEMVLVPALPREGKPPAPPFLLDRHEVTVAQYQAFCKETGRRSPTQPSQSTSRHPVVEVDARDALAYARWAGRRLPTWEEWDRGAYGRPLLETGVPAAMPWGLHDSFKARNLEGREDGQPGLTFAASFPLGMSACGALDMVGNAAEWVDRGWLIGGSFETPRRLRLARLVRAAGPSTGFRCAADLAVDAR